MGKRFKVVLLGDATVGKSSLCTRLVWNRFSTFTDSTIGAAFLTTPIDQNNYIDLWDTAGQERYHALTQLYYRNANVILLVFDLSNLESINRLDKYIDEIKISLHNRSDYLFVIIGNKSDLITDPEELNSIEKIIKKQFRRINPGEEDPEYLITSAKESTNIDLLSETLKNYFYQIEESLEEIYEKDPKNIRFTKDSLLNKNSCSC